MDATIQAKIPEQLLHVAQSLIREGWVSDLDALVAEALRRYLESHQPHLTESFIREDVEWGLYGKL
jgi:Arc/MetJ-type ribon-helix-helix transcriptional regulator